MVAIAVENDAGSQAQCVPHLHADRFHRLFLGRHVCQHDLDDPRRVRFGALDEFVVDSRHTDRQRPRGGELPEQCPHRSLQKWLRLGVDTVVGRQLADLGGVQEIGRIVGQGNQVLASQAVGTQPQELLYSVGVRVIFQVQVQHGEDDPLGVLDQSFSLQRCGFIHFASQERLELTEGETVHPLRIHLTARLRAIETQHDLLQGRRRYPGELRTISALAVLASIGKDQGVFVSERRTGQSVGQLLKPRIDEGDRLAGYLGDDDLALVHCLAQSIH